MKVIQKVDKFINSPNETGLTNFIKLLIINQLLGETVEIFNKFLFCLNLYQLTICNWVIEMSP